MFHLKARRTVFFIFELILFFILISNIALAFCLENELNQNQTKNNSANNFTLFIYSKAIVNESNFYLDPGVSVNFNITDTADGFKLRRMEVQIGATNRSFLREMQTDLYVTTYDLWGGSMGAWTSDNNFFVSNPSNETQHIFLKTTSIYSHRAYATDIINGKHHSIIFNVSQTVTQLSVNWGFFGVLESLQVNGSQVNLTHGSSEYNFLMEYLSYGAVFYSSMSNTTFVFNIEEKSLTPPPESPYIGAWIGEHNVITLNPHQEFLFAIPNLEGWTYTYGNIESNITFSRYPQPHPFKYVNLAVWNYEDTPVLATITNTTYGIINLSDKTYCLEFDTTLYYWQNTAGLTASTSHSGDTNSIYHKYSVEVLDDSLGTELGLKGQFLAFESVPTTALGRTSKTISYQAPDPVGRWEGSYIPLKKGNYSLVTVEPKIAADLNINQDYAKLSTTLSFEVSYAGEPIAGANIRVNQNGLFKSATYCALTDKNGRANITVASNGPEIDQLNVEIIKDDLNYKMMTVTVVFGAVWLLALAAALVITSVYLTFIIIRRRRKRV